MVDAQVLRELAQEVARLSGSDASIDASIRRALRGWHPLSGVLITPTQTLSEAAELMPEGWFVKVEKNSHNWWVCVARSRGYSEQWSCDTIAATEPLARAACALRAIASDIEAKEADRHA